MQVAPFQRILPYRRTCWRALAAPASLAVSLAGSSTAAAQWPQWGGQGRDFRSSATGLAEEWPEEGPRKLWERVLGPGYSSIVADGGRLFTLYRSGEEEVVVALEAKTGATEWEHRYRAGGTEPPNSTPTVEGNKVYTLGFSGQLRALDTATGKLAWSHDLVQEYAAQRPQYGFATSPLAHGGALIVPVGGAGIGVAAFALENGELLWREHDFGEIYASPILIDVEGETQVVVLVAHRVVGLSPQTGELLWSEPIEGDQNIATPIWCPGGVLCVTAGTNGSIGLKLSKAEGKTRVTKLWANAVQISQTTVVHAGDLLYGSTGHDPFFVTAIRAATGEVAWREPGFSLANLVGADGKILLLDAEGVLALATAGPEAWKVSSRATLIGPQGFTPPSLADRTLYLRHLEKILAFDVGRQD